MSGEAMQRVREWNAKELSVGGIQFVTETRWKWSNGNAALRECDDGTELLAHIGDRVCIEKGDNGVSALVLSADGEREAVLQFGSEEQWDVVYDIESADGMHQKMCRFIETVELCFELAKEHDIIEATSHVL